ncbi:MAG: thymidylate kinase, partial [Oscillospiraceae bacterium]|nr:thymidylate kinase [Oscillospiraceae bacterium]
LYDYEHEKLGLPPADKVIFLDMPTNISQKLLSKRYNGDESRKDIHEAHVSYLENCRKTALYAANKLDWTVTQCSDGENPLPVEVISENVMKEISKVI